MKIETGNGGFGSSIILFLAVGFFIPAIWAMLAVIVFGIWTASLVSQYQIASVSIPSKLQLRVPVAPPSIGVSLSRHDAKAIIQSTNAKAAGRRSVGIQRARGTEESFERVCLRERERRGVKISRIGWKGRDGSSIGDESARNVTV